MRYKNGVMNWMDALRLLLIKIETTEALLGMTRPFADVL